MQQNESEVNDENNHNHNGIEVIGPHRSEASPKIYKLTVDCFDEIFEYLSLKDLHSFAQTSKAMQQVAGEYFKQNYTALRIASNAFTGIYTDFSEKFGYNMRPHINISGFNQFITSIDVHKFFSRLAYIEPQIDEFISINHISLTGISTSSQTVQRILKRVESVAITVEKCEDLFKYFLTFCTNLRRLYVNGDFDCWYYRQTGKRKWLFEIYSKLQHFELIPQRELVINELNTFMECNKTIRTFATSSKCLWYNRHAFQNSEAHLDTLEVKCFFDVAPNQDPPMQSLCNLINELYDQGFYKHLHFYVEEFDNETNILVASLKAIKKLCIRKFSDVSLTLPIELRELAILDFDENLLENKYLRASNMEMLANSLVNLQRLYVINATIDDIMPFIRKSVNLRKIKMMPKEQDELRFQLSDRKITNINFQTMNREREKLFEARKITLYVQNNKFLVTKWTTKDGDTNLKFIELKRAESFVWNHRF